MKIALKKKKKEKKTAFSHKIRFEEILVLVCSSSCQCLGWAVAASTRWHPRAAGARRFLSCQPRHNAAGPADGSEGEGSSAAFLPPTAFFPSRSRRFPLFCMQVSWKRGNVEQDGNEHVLGGTKCTVVSCSPIASAPALVSPTGTCQRVKVSMCRTTV